MSASENRLAGYRMTRAAQSLADADLLAQAGSWNGCVNRLYYGCFYAASALMARDGETTSKHTGVRSFLNQHYIHSGRIEPNLGKFYNELFDIRLDGDYEDFTAFEEQAVRSLIPLAQQFVARVDALLQPSTASDTD